MLSKISSINCQPQPEDIFGFYLVIFDSILVVLFIRGGVREKSERGIQKNNKVPSLIHTL